MSGAQRNDDLGAINSGWDALIEFEETMNAIFTLAVATVVVLCFGLAAMFVAGTFNHGGLQMGLFPYDTSLLNGLFGFFVLFFAARLGDEWARVKVHLTGALRYSRDSLRHYYTRPTIRQTLNCLFHSHPLSGPVSRSAMIHTLGAGLAEGYLAGFDRTVLGVQLFNVVVTTPRLLYSVFALLFIIVNLLVSSS